MTWVIVVADLESNTALAAATAAPDEKRVDSDLVGDKLSILFGDKEIEFERSELYAREFKRDDAMDVVAIPHRYSIKVTTDPTSKKDSYTLEEPNEEVTLSFVNNKPVITVNSGVTADRKAWVIVKSGNTPPQRKYQGIPAQQNTVTFPITVSSGDVVIGLVVGHRADIRRVP